MMDRNTIYDRSFTFRDYLERTYLILALGLGITTLSAFIFSMVNPMFIYRMYFILLLAQFGLTVFFSSRLMTMSKQSAWICYIAYSALMGMSLSSLLYVYSGTSIILAFGTTTVLFICMSVIGKTTNVDLSKFSGLMMTGLIAMIVVSLVNTFFFHATQVEMLLCYVGIILFLGIIAYDTQQLHSFYSHGFVDSELSEKIVIFGAFQLYLDFLNLFVRILQMFGRRRND